MAARRVLGAAACCLSLLSGSDAAVSRSGTTPVTKIIEMLKEMKVKGASAAQLEREVFAKYDQFVDDKSTELKQEITTLNAEIEELVATIGKKDSDVKGLHSKIADIDVESGRLEADQKDATKVRETQRAAFVEAQTDYQESLYALDRAIQTLKAQNYDREQAAAFLQSQAKATKGMRRVLAALELRQATASSADGAPAVAAYEFQSSSIVDLLEQLRDKFKAELRELETEEANGAHAHDLEMLHLGNVVGQLKEDRQEHASIKAQTASESAAAKGDLADARASLKEAQVFLQDLTSTHAMKKSAFELNQQVRAEEMEALSAAIEILAKPEVAASYATHVKEFVQLPRAASVAAPGFLQTRSSTSQEARTRALAVLGDRAKSLHSRDLEAIVQEAREGPFGKVIGLIEDLLAKLKAEAAAEKEHKEWCDEELHQNKLKRDQLDPATARLAAQVEQKSLAIEGMGQKIATLAQEQASLRDVLTQATATRTEEKKLNMDAIADSQAGQSAVKQALVVLREFYAKQGGGEAALVQASAGNKGKQVPEMAAYKGMQGKEGGVIGMLEVIASDFARVESDTKASEAEAARAFAELSRDTDVSLKQKHESEYRLSLEKDQAEFERSRLRKDLAASQKQLDMANAYYQELKPQCLVVHVSYEERVSRRQEEIAALKEAYRVLNGEAGEAA
eukprot:TRINITY_DN45967_c0_g1_i1.p1 TRINITY_DN45967_c0_g1~~TRINITY_DN45967_c0_g1_i1.p1  ORF type:complete len:719 (+),score=236.06 TRINITY_DN45967_c0_g1_i1:110-2158(+)